MYDLAGAGRLPLIVYCGENLCYYIVNSNSNNSEMVKTSTVTFLFYLNHFSIIHRCYSLNNIKLLLTSIHLFSVWSWHGYKWNNKPVQNIDIVCIVPSNIGNILCTSLSSTACTIFTVKSAKWAIRSGSREVYLKFEVIVKLCCCRSLKF